MVALGITSSKLSDCTRMEAEKMVGYYARNVS
jgi:hypothetical protein